MKLNGFEPVLPVVAGNVARRVEKLESTNQRWQNFRGRNKIGEHTKRICRSNYLYTEAAPARTVGEIKMNVPT